MNCWEEFENRKTNKTQNIHSTAQHNYTLITVNLTEKYEENTPAVRLNRRAAGVFACKTAVL